MTSETVVSILIDFCGSMPITSRYGGTLRSRSFTPTNARIRMSAGLRKRNFEISAARQK